VPRGHGALTSEAATEIAFDKRMDKPQAYTIAGEVWVTGRIRWSGHKAYAQLQGDDMITHVVRSSMPLPAWNAAVDFAFTSTVLLKLDREQKIREVLPLTLTPFVVSHARMNVASHDSVTAVEDAAATWE
jgi:hypothetical protein